MLEMIKSDMKLYLLGSGYVGQALQAQYSNWSVFTRSPKTENEQFFDAENLESYEMLHREVLCQTQKKCAVLTFNLASLSATAMSLLTAFVFKSFDVVLIYSTTSVYKIETGILNEIQDDSALDLNNERALREEVWRSLGAQVLTLAGIWGSYAKTTRHPVQWLNKNLIPLQKKSVFLIHIDDIVFLTFCVINDCEKAFLSGVKIEGQRYLFCDGKEHMWMDIIGWARAQKLIPEDFVRIDRPIQEAQRLMFPRRILRYISEKSLVCGEWIF